MFAVIIIVFILIGIIAFYGDYSTKEIEKEYKEKEKLEDEWNRKDK